MTVSGGVARDDYNGNDITTEFAVTFKFTLNSDVQVVLYNTVTAVETTLVESTNYTLTGAGDESGGTLTMLVAPTSNETLTFIRNLVFSQTYDYVEHTTFPADSHESALDKLTMLLQQLDESMTRVLRQPVSQSGSLELPISVADMFLRWAADGSLVNFDIADLSLYSVTPYAETILECTDSSEARGVLGIDATYTVTAQAVPDRTVAIAELKVFFGSSRVDYAGIASADMGESGDFETSTISASYYNKLLFTLDSSGTLASHEGTASATIGGVVEPTLPSDEFPICVILFQDDGSAAPGTILAVSQTAITQTLRINSAQFSEVVKDTTPQLGGELDAQAHSIGFTLQVATGGGATTVDWKLGNKAKHTFGAQNETFTFTAPSKPCSLMLMLVQDVVGSRTVTWPVSVKWPSGIAPLLSTSANSVDIISFFYDGTNYNGAASLDFQ